MSKSNLTEITVWYQTILTVAGDQDGLVVDGKFGASTKQALECFQVISGLEPSGVLDVPTNVALNQVAMDWLYRKLIPTPRGKMTDELRNALKRFQNDYGLEADGKVGPATREVMVRVLRTELPSPLRHFHAHLGQGGPPTASGPSEPMNVALEAATPSDPSGKIKDHQDREQTSNTIDRPFRWVCLVTPEYKSAKVGSASGLLISPRHVLTAAHVILDDVDDGDGRRQLEEVVRVSVDPGHDQRPIAERTAGMKPFGTLMGPGRHTPDCYRQRSCSKSCDYALIELEQPIGNRKFDLRIRDVDGKRKLKTVTLGYWGDSPGFEIRAVSQTDLNGVKIFSAGYPHEFNRVQMRARGEGVDNARTKPIRERLPSCYGNVLCHTADTTVGQSGSPVWRLVEQNGKSVFQLVGIAIEAANPEYNYALALTEEVLKQIEKWAPTTFQYSGGVLSVTK
ncbi:MAG TPA: peptidoglycan-binding protein [Pyrinomonadaceae bacterium]|jgi:V8-like Glu-specific endopeptidase